MQGVNDVSAGKESVRAVVCNKHGIGHLVRIRRFPRAGETVRALEWKYGEDAGKGTNVSVALGLLGVSNAFVCKVGADEGGRIGETMLRAANVDCSHYVMDPGLTTDVGIVVTQVDGENFIIGCAEHPCYLSEEELRGAIDDYPQAELFISGFDISQSLSLQGCRFAKERGKRTLLNASPLKGPLTQTLEYVDYLFVNEVEGRELAGGEGNWRQVAEAVRGKYRPRVVVMTLGSKGCVLCDESGCRYFPAYETRCVDTVAAGDGFMAAFAAGLIWGKSDAEAADWANLYGAIVVSRKGSILSYPTLTEVQELSRGLKHCDKEGSAENVL